MNRGLKIELAIMFGFGAILTGIIIAIARYFL